MMKWWWKILTVVLCTLSVGQVRAWDEVTHAYITRLAIDRIADPELKKLLKIHEDDFLSGSWYTDTYQYTDHRIKQVNPHILQWHTAAFEPYLQDAAVQQQSNYNRLLALYLGSLAHTTEDFWLDSNLYDYPPSVGDRVTGDTYNGVIDISRYHYLTLRVKPYLPLDDLYNIYNKAGLLPENIHGENAFFSMVRSWSNHQYVKLRLLKLLSFLASGQVGNASPWTTANMYNAPGGISDCATSAAMMVEAAWRRIRKSEASPVLSAAYIWADSTLSILTSYPVKSEDVPQKNAFVISQHGDTLAGILTQKKYGDSEINRTNMVLKFHPERPFHIGESYTFYWLPGSYGDQNEIIQKDLYTYRFTAGMGSQKISKATIIPWWRTLGTGLFLFAICVALAGIFYGFSGVVSFSREGSKSINFPWLTDGVNLLFQILGVALFVVGVYLLVTRGWFVVLHV